MLGGPRPALAATIYEQEPNDTYATAQELPEADFEIRSGGTYTVKGYSNEVGGIDRDHYRITITEDHELRLVLSRRNSATQIFAVLRHDSNGNGVPDSDEYFVNIIAATPDNPIGAITLKGMDNGLYFIEVFSISHDSTNYTLKVTANTSKPTQKEYEPKTATANAVEGYIVGNRYLEGSLNSGPFGTPRDTVDHYRFSVRLHRSTHNVTIYVYDLQSTVSVHLYHDKNSDGQIDAGKEFVASDSGASGGYAKISQPLNRGEYILKIFKSINTGFTPYKVTLSD